MTLVVNLSPELEEQLREKAVRQGQDINIVVARLLTSVLESESHDVSDTSPIINAEQALKNQAAIDLLDSWLVDDEDAAEHDRAWDFLKTALDEDRLLLPMLTNPLAEPLPWRIAINATEVSPRTKPSNYPEPFALRMVGREKCSLGDLFGITNFGVNLTRLAPNAISSLRHAHSTQDEFIYILQGQPTLQTDAGRTQLAPGMCAGFKAGTGNSHNLINETLEEVIYLEIGDRLPGDEGTYPDDDLQALLVEGKWQFAHKDGTPY